MKKNEEIIIRKFRDNEGRAVSAIIQNNLAQHRDENLASEDIKVLQEKFTPGHVISLSKNRKMYVALMEEVVVGVASIEGNMIDLVCVDALYHRKGIGKKLLGLMEEIAANSGYGFVRAAAAAGTREFYEKLGYKVLKNVESDDKGKSITLEKGIF